ncbi:DNA-3-methyladenine glycosylase I [Streptohalobacillus salinus]|uniref:DNA-3-methyladenine glycosylase I n=1 Tax=Streptohalobacillus salinus TaxID=621096 RepID=A0A2V3WGF4_9BACI|nr:DNA-3-methyladenine glycosylase I [Streptohalobacillus salinus]PXW92929.1 DNA-3-methyladenine glycosylase I [Streptohalobacillus salinus]
MVHRCHWVTSDPIYIDYHDKEWGEPVSDTKALFEAMTLEVMQAGLSFLIVLKKREHMRKAFFNYDLNQLSQHSDQQIEQWLQNDGLIRHEQKLKTLKKHAQIVQEIEKNQSFYNYLVTKIEETNLALDQKAHAPITAHLANKLSKQLKKEGFSFLGPVTLYSFLEATGFLNNHETNCFKHEALSK